MPAQTAPALTITVPGRLTPAQLRHAAGPLEIRLADGVRDRVAANRAYMMRCLAEGRPIYGASTGFGPLVVHAGRADDVDQSESILAHLSAGQGPDLEPGTVRAMMLVRLHSLTRGHSGASTATIDALIAALRTPLVPAVPRLGSVGASGDLIPLAHMVQALKGSDGAHAYIGAEHLPAAQALRRLGLPPLRPDGRDGLALVNGTSLTAATAGLAVAELDRSHAIAAVLTCVLVDVLGAAPTFLAPQLLEAFGHPEVAEVGERMRALLAGSRPSGLRALQEPYSLRCTPQLLGPARSHLDHARQVITRDLNSISDNPLFFPGADVIAHGGNFFSQPAAFAADVLVMVATQLGNLAERQLDLLVDPHRNTGLPALLAADPGRQHGVAGVQLAATALVADMRRRVIPISSQSLPTNLHNQDIVPLGTLAAQTAWEVTRSLRLLHGSLAVALRQAVHLGARPTAPACTAIVDALMEAIPPIDPDRPLHGDVRRAADLLDEITAEHHDEDPLRT
ncbi:aromatic amino acid lyase [Actinomadura craniellae]|uniref:Aromatic amino acid lyase n=1 Tax=Actinomadura craniellae TaxID=2231787 RepID=A0A365HCR1_9ACTN|nr:aromatic amino acid ammonia-lyase [Actinomadura craniellae]RAY16891.1 aromatic amino acid lyase [Actinomadura craniellae]